MKARTEPNWTWVMQIGVLLIIIAIVYAIWRKRQYLSKIFLKLSDESYLFFKSHRGVMVSLFLLILVFAYMYTKLYWQINPFPFNTFTDLFSSIIVGIALSTGTLVVIINTENKELARWFAFADFLASLLFFTKAIPAWHTEVSASYAYGTWKFYFSVGMYIGASAFISLMKAILIFNYADIFMRLSKQAFNDRELLERLEVKVKELTGLLEKEQKTNKELQQEVRQLRDDNKNMLDNLARQDAEIRLLEPYKQRYEEIKQKKGGKKKTEGVNIPSTIDDGK